MVPRDDHRLVRADAVIHALHDHGIRPWRAVRLPQLGRRLGHSIGQVWQVIDGRKPDVERHDHRPPM